MCVRGGPLVGMGKGCEDMGSRCTLAGLALACCGCARTSIATRRKGFAAVDEAQAGLKAQAQPMRMRANWTSVSRADHMDVDVDDAPVSPVNELVAVLRRKARCSHVTSLA